MFERFTELARRVVVTAQDHAMTFRHDEIDIDHLLLGVRDASGALGEQILSELDDHRGILDSWTRQVAESRERGETAPVGQVPFTEEAKRVLDLSLREALTLGHRYIGTEHILIALGRLPQMTSYLEPLGGPDVVKEKIFRYLAAPQGRTGDEIVEAAQEIELPPPPIVFTQPDGSPLATFDLRPPRPPRPPRRPLRPNSREWLETPPRCGHVLSLYGADFFCQDDRGHQGKHSEHIGDISLSWGSE